LQRKQEQLKNKEQKNPQLLCAIGIVLFAAISTALKKWWQKELLFDNNPLAASDKLSALYFIS
jgi:hypothetical protein